MEQLITANVATNLYWFGRYLERIEATLLEIMTASDKTIDTDKNAGVKLFKKLEMDLEYKDTKDFLNNAVFGNHDSNINNLMEYARENAIISRADMYTEAFGSAIELSNLIKHGKLPSSC
mgnify:CR=1 FL=1